MATRKPNPKFDKPKSDKPRKAKIEVRSELFDLALEARATLGDLWPQLDADSIFRVFGALRVGLSQETACLAAMVARKVWGEAMKVEGFAEIAEACSAAPIVKASTVIVDLVNRGDFEAAKFFLRSRSKEYAPTPAPAAGIEFDPGQEFL